MAFGEIYAQDLQERTKHINALGDAKTALIMVTENCFEEDLARFTGIGGPKLTQSSKDAIEQYKEIVAQANMALKHVIEVIG